MPPQAVGGAARGEDSLARRYAVKLAASVAGLGTALAVQALVPRALGPAAFGDYSFLLNFFTQLIGFVSLGTGVPYFTLLSRRQTDGGLVTFYAYAAAVIAIALGLFVAVATAGGWMPAILPGQQMAYVAAAAVLAFATWHAQIIGETADAWGMTARTELARVAQKLVSIGLLVALYVTGSLTLGSYFAYGLVSIGMLYLAWSYMVSRHSNAAAIPWRLSLGEAKRYAGEFEAMVTPLVIYSGALFLALTFDRWLLQTVEGSVEQGYFGFSMQLGTMIFLTASALTPLLAREFSMAAATDDRAAMGATFTRHGKRLFFVVAYFGCFVAIQAGAVVELFGGDRFSGSIAAVSVMALYPVHQTYGQLNGYLYFATGRMKQYRNAGILTLLGGVGLSVLLLLPERVGGLGLGSLGLAIKMLGLQWISATVLLVLNARFLGVRAGPLLLHQVVALGTLVTVAGIAEVAMRGLPLVPFWRFMASGILYTALVAIIAWVAPWLSGFDRDLLRRLRSSLRSKHAAGAGSMDSTDNTNQTL